MFNPNYSNIIMINGSGGCGKSTFCTFCREFTNELRYTGHWSKFGALPPVVVELSTIDYVKGIAKETGWDGKKDEKGRAYLSSLKDAMEEYDHIPSKKVLESIIKAWTLSKNNLTYLFFVNIREPENMQYFSALCHDKGWPCSSLLVTNPNVPIITTNHADSNVSNYNYNYYISNEGTLKDLRKKAEEFICVTLGYFPRWESKGD